MKSISLEEAIEHILGSAKEIKIKEVTLLSALGKILAKDVTATMDQPPFPRSPVDGYALCAADTKHATKNTPIRFPVDYCIFAGDDVEAPPLSGHAVQIMTGSRIPQGCDCVIRQEHVIVEDGYITIMEALSSFDNYCFQGEDFKKNEILLHVGTKLNATALAVAAANGVSLLKIYESPKVSVISTGNELIEPGKPLGDGKIYNANLTYLHGRLLELGMEPMLLSTVGDNIDTIITALDAAAQCSDFIVTTGGVSVGQKDLLPLALETMGAETIFHGIALKPGSPALFAQYQGIPFLCLSGNPFAAAATFELLGRPLLAKLSKNQALAPKAKTAILQTDFLKKSPTRRFVRGAYQDGTVSLPQGHSSGQLRSALGCNCLLDIPANSDMKKAGEAVTVLL